MKNIVKDQKDQREAKNDTVKYTIILSQDQERQLENLQKLLGASSRAETFRKSINIANVIAEARKQKRDIVIMYEGKPVERLIIA
jgi:hypothetical protein